MLGILATGMKRVSMQLSCSQKIYFFPGGCMFQVWRSPHQSHAQISCAVSMMSSDLFGNDGSLTFQNVASTCARCST